MSIVLVGSTSGSITLQEPAVAGTTTLTLPATTGTVVVGSSAVSATGQIPFSTDGSTYTPTAKIVSGTSVASTSGTSIDFTSIPSWVKRITVMFNGVSTNSTSQVQIQLGSTTFSTSGYSSTSSYGGSIGQLAFATTGFITDPAAAAIASITRSGIYQFTLVNSNNWVGSGNIGTGVNGQVTLACGGNSPTLSGALDRVRITTVNGTDTFDAGTINILYE